MEWTGIGCDVCGFGSVENVDEFDPMRPCPECGEIMVQPTPSMVAAVTAKAFVDKMIARGVEKLSDEAVRYHLSLLLKEEWKKLANVTCGNCNTKGCLAPIAFATMPEPSIPKEEK